jgi:hypothetical protein
MKKKRKSWKNSEFDSELEVLFWKHWKKAYPNSLPAKQHKFCPGRNYRFDFAWLSKKVAIEIQGYGPGHNSREGMTRDYDKHYEALKLNWKVIYLTSIHLSPPRIIDTTNKIATLLDLQVRDGYIPLKWRQ